jgi:hypothetical protein
MRLALPVSLKPAPLAQTLINHNQSKHRLFAQRQSQSVRISSDSVVDQISLESSRGHLSVMQPHSVEAERERRQTK